MAEMAKLGPAEVAVIETFVVDRYLQLFGEAAMSMMLTGEVAAVAHLGCRTGYPDRELVQRVPNCTVVGTDASPAAIELARNKAATLPGAELSYLVAYGYPSELPSGGFSHTLSLHPFGVQQDRLDLFAEMERLLYAGGQALIAMPIRGSFQELGDLFLEYALKHDEGELAQHVELVLNDRPTIEVLAEELEAVGFDDIDVHVYSTELAFSGGRSFTEDPTTRLLVLPDLLGEVNLRWLDAAMDYVREAVDKYWSESEFQLTVNVGAASARKH